MKAMKPMERTPNTGYRALVVDDEVALAGIVASYLEREHFDVSVAHDGHDALSLAREIDPDVVVLDLAQVLGNLLDNSLRATLRTAGWSTSPPGPTAADSPSPSPTVATASPPSTFPTFSSASTAWMPLATATTGALESAWRSPKRSSRHIVADSPSAATAQAPEPHSPSRCRSVAPKPERYSVPRMPFMVSISCC
jgi:hypothetical protein